MYYLNSLPPFDKDKHYRELSPKEGNNNYRFVTLKDIEIHFTNNIIPKGNVLLFMDSSDRVWMEMTSTTITISSNYAWNGCSPKKWCGLWWGTPDFEDTIIASLVHDCLIQFSNTNHFPFSRFECDNIFKYILHENKFCFEKIYYMGVRIGSNFLPHGKYNTKSMLTTYSVD